MQFLFGLKKRAHTTSALVADTPNPQLAMTSVENKERGDASMREAHWEQATQYYRQAIAGNPSYTVAHLNLGFVLMQQGSLQEAQHHLTRALELDPSSADANYLLGTLNLANGRQEVAEEHFRKALLQASDFFPAYESLCSLLMQNGRLDDAIQIVLDGVQHHSDLADLHYLLGNLHLEQRQLDSAVSSFKKTLDSAPFHPNAYANLGLALLQQGDFAQAATVLQKATSLNPGSADVYNNLGSALHGKEKFEEAIAAFKQGIAIDSHSDRLHGNLGLSLHADEQHEEAIEQFRTALSLNPQNSEMHFNLGNSLFAQKKTKEAIAAFQTFLDNNPRHLNAYINLGNAHQEIGETGAALNCFEQVLNINPNHAVAHYCKGNVLRSQSKNEAAIEQFKTALENDANFVDAYVVLADTLFDMGRVDEAKQMYQRVLEIEPNHSGARWDLAMLTIPAIPASQDEVVESRSKFSGALTELNNWFSEDRIKSGAERVGNLVPFYLTYHEENNRPLLFEYGQLCSRLTKYWADKHLPALTKRKTEDAAPIAPIRVGIVSAHIYKNHPVWNALVKGWFDHRNPNQIELHVFYLGDHFDGETTWAKSRSTSFESGKRDFTEWARIIQDKQVDVLVYPEIGMGRLAVKLASLRMAPVQVTTWGHPETSGLPTMDYFLSAVDLEPENAQDNYTEQLVLLPKLGCHYYVSEVETITPDMCALGISMDIPVLLCPGTSYKYAPKHDHVFIDIARKLGKCQFVFFSNPMRALTDKLRARLNAAFNEARMNFDDFCIFIPWQDKSTFYGLMKQADVFLDTIGFSGFNTAIQALECDLPIVTREGRFMRGRLGSGILRHIGLQELIADSDSGYVDLVVKLAQDPSYRNSVRQRIASSRETLFNNRASVAAWEEFLISVTRTSRQTDSSSTKIITDAS